jgi:hypothetical protein
LPRRSPFPDDAQRQYPMRGPADYESGRKAITGIG